MPEVVVEKVVVLDQDLYRTNGMVQRWMVSVMRQFYLGTMNSTPVRTGRLRASERWEVHREGERLVGGALTVGAKHGGYVLRGTGGPDGRIYTTRAFASRGANAKKREQRWIVLPEGRAGSVRMSSAGRRGAFLADVPVRQKGHWLWVPESKFSEKRTWMVSVRGQKANNFLLKGWRKMVRRHSSLRTRVPLSVLDP